MTYFACKVTVEDAEAFKPGQAYVVGIATDLQLLPLITCAPVLRMIPV